MEMKTLTVNGKTYIVADPDAAHFDNSKPGDGAWSGKHTVDQLCPAFTESGSVVRCTPVEGYPLSVVSRIEPVQEGEGDPRPAGWSAVADVAVQADSPGSVSIPADLLTHGQTYRLLVNAANAAGEQVQLSPECSMVAYNEGGGVEADITVGDYYIEFAYSSYGVSFSLVYEEAVDESSMFDIDGGDVRILKDGIFVLQEYDPGNIRPITGHSEVKLWHSGKNLLPYPYVESSKTTNEGVTYTDNGDGTITLNGTPATSGGNTFTLNNTIELKDGVEYFLNDGTEERYVIAYIQYLDENGTSRWYSKYTTPSSLVWNKNYTLRKIYVQLNEIKTFDNVIICPQLEVGSTPTPYEPYRGEALTIDLGQTVYGGAYNWQTGELVIDTLLKELGVKDMNNHDDYPGWKTQSWAAEVADLTVDKMYYIPCNMYAGVRINKSGDVYFLASNLGATQTQLQEANPDLVCQFVFSLLKPVTVQLTPQELLALSGENTLYSDTGDTQVSGRADPVAVMEKLTNAIIALGGSV